MTFIDAIKICFVKYAQFSGRAPRSEYWFFFLFYFLLSACMDIIDATIAGETVWSYSGYFGPAQLILSFLIMIPFSAVSVRRLHDINKSGWWWCLSLTVIGLIPLIIWLCNASDSGSNNYGKDPFENSKRTAYKAIPTWVKYFLLPAGSLILLALVIIGLLLETGIILDSKVYEGSELPDSQKNKLVNAGIIDEDDKIIFFYSNGFFSITESGQLLTNDEVIMYQENDDGLLKKYKMLLGNVKAVELLEKGSFWSYSRYKLIGNKNANFENIEIVLDVESDRDKEFINEIRKRIK